MPTLNQQGQHYILERDPLTARQALFLIISLPIAAVRWFFSFFIGLIVTNLALNPYNIRHQRRIHCLADEDSEVIVNLQPRESFKNLRDLFHKAYFLLTWIPFFKLEKNRMQPTSESYEHIDSLVDEIKALLTGTSSAKHCEHRTFEWNNIHIKGLDSLEPSLQDYFWQTLEESTNISQTTPHQKLFDFFTLQTWDGAILDAVEVLNQDAENTPIDERRFIVHCMVRDKNYITQLLEFRRTAEATGATVVGHNYRGVCYSKGLVWTQDNMVDDTVSHVERLILQGAKPEHICLDGQCLGGVIATLAAEKLYDLGYTVNVVNDRSFQTLPKFLAGYILPEPNENVLNPLVLSRYLLGGIVYGSMVTLLWLSQWQMNAANAWHRIPSPRKTYVVAHEMNNGSLVPSDGIVHSWVTIAALEKQVSLENIFIPARYVDNELDSEDEHEPEDIDGSRIAHHISWRKHLVQAYPNDSNRLSARSFIHSRQRLMMNLESEEVEKTERATFYS